MRSTIKIREQFNLSQEQLAIFLGVTRSQIALAETGRRHLSTTALLQVARLEKALQNNIDYPLLETETTAKSLTQKGMTAMKAHAFNCCQEATAARNQLVQMEQQHQRCTKVLMALGHLLHHLPQTKESEKEKLWLQLLQRQTNAEILECTPVEQVKVLLKAEALEQQAARALSIKF
jgi:transcriptional regulator with XRE-family HTH domain